MINMIKKYIPYAVIIAAIYMLVPLFFVFTGATFQAYTPAVYDVIFPLTAVVCSVIFGGKHGIDFFFSLVAPIIYIPSMLIYNGISASNVILVAIYLVSSILGLFIGDMFFSSKRKPEEPPLDVDLDIEESTPVVTENVKSEVKEPVKKTPKTQKKPSSANSRKSNSSDDFFENYSSDNHSDPKSSAEDEIDKILKEIHTKD